MRLFAIGDLHLPGGDEKPMNVFGEQWDNHFQRISEAWQSMVSPEDTVLIPGDISWAMQLKDARPDLEAIGALPGRKILSKGNHDYWWGSISRVREALPESVQALQHDCVELEKCVVCGTRGWTIPTQETPLGEEDTRLLNRELVRLELSLQEAEKRLAGRPLVVMLHYPPLYDLERDTPVTRLLEQHPVHTVVYGHLHGAGIRAGFTGEEKGIRYYLTSCDALGFSPIEIPLE